MEESKICNFYRDKHIFLTGATGFMGKLIIEKLLRVCKPKMIYLLVRTKKNSEPQKRLLELTQSPMLDRLKKEVPDFMDHLSIVSGDASLPGLDLLPSDREVLIDKVQVVLHCAATVKFDEKLSLSTKINVQGTLSVIELCHKMKNLQSVVCVSTAYSNCPYKNIKEEFYDAPISSDNLVKLTECLKEQQLENITPYVLDKWPNTYVFTKAIAEDAIKTYGKGLPIAVFRPAIMIATKNEPIPGWSDNLYGPQGLSLGAGIGLIRVIRCDPNCKADIIPADLAINCLLAVAYKTSLYETPLDIPVYNYSTIKENSITWGEYVNLCVKRGLEIPSSKSIWYCSCTVVKSWLVFFFLTFLVHTLPALIVDIGLVLMNKKPRALNTYKKIHKVENLLAAFSTNCWDFSADNTLNLWKSLPEIDKTLFDFDMTGVHFETYLSVVVDGIRRYMVNEDESTIPYCRKRQYVLYLLHRFVQLVFFSGVGWCLWRFTSFVLG